MISFEKSKATRLFGFALLSLLILLAFSSPAAAQEPLPQTPPDANNGLDVFADRCANCHGVQGQGDGEMAGQLALPPRDFTQPDFRQTAVPAEMFATITNGRLEGGMPPFGPTSSNAIPEAVRWDLVAAVYSLATPATVLEQGEALFMQECAACHGEDGAGNGPDATAQETAPTALTDFNYWYNRSNQQVFTALQDETIAGHDYTLTEDELWDVVDYGRSFSYVYTDPDAPIEPIESAIIGGNVSNGTTGEPFGGGTAELSAFTPEFAQALTLTTTVSADGSYSFNLTDVPPDWIYITTVDYGDLNFNSNPAMLSADVSFLELPIVVFDTTSDSEAISIGQIHMIMDFQNDALVVSEVYIFNNSADGVFVGESGEASAGTLELVLPAGAENVNFERGYGTLDNFFPAPEFFQTERGWADTVPLRPGQAAMNLLVTYTLPYDDGMKVAHPVFYEVANATVVLSDVGVALEDNAWMQFESTMIGAAGAFLTYEQPGLAAGDAVSFTLVGEPEQRAVAADGSNAIVRNDNLEMIIGGRALMAVVIAALFLVRSWLETAASAIPTDGDTQIYLQAIANLDDAYEAGKIDSEKYTQQRAELLADLAAIWPV